MAKNKTVVNDSSVDLFLNEMDNEQKKQDMNTLLKIMGNITNQQAKMWGTSIIGFDEYHYVYGSGREGDMFLTGCSPRKNNISIYVMAGLKRYTNQLKELGKHKVGKSCLYIKCIEDIDQNVLIDIITDSVAIMKKKYK